MFNAATDSNDSQNCYAIGSSKGSNGLTLIKPELSLKDVIPSSKDTYISGRIYWDNQVSSFVADFYVENKSAGTIVLSDELTFDSIGITLYGPKNTASKFSNLQITYHYASIPEASSTLLLLLAIPLLAIRRTRPVIKARCSTAMKA